MSQANSIQDLAQYPDNQVIASITVKVEKVWSTKDPGNFRITNTKVSDSLGNNCSMAFFHKPNTEPPITEGNTYTVSSKIGNRGLTGLQKTSYQGKPQLKASDSAIISPAGQSPMQAPQQVQQPVYEAPQQPMQQQMPQSLPPQQQAPPTPSGGDPRATYVASWMATFGSALKTLEAAAPHLSIEVKAKVASQCASDVPAHWFGKKSLEAPEG